MSKLKLLDLFSGIGGFSLGLESTGGFETIAFVEKDKFCQKVLKKHWSNINIEEDIRNVKGERYAADVITGGFPCQPFSVAGKRKGKDDDRYLWDETIRVIRECKPKWFVGENVEGIVNIANGTVLQQIQQDLEKEGFEVQCGIIPASGIGAWHQRKRVWIIGCNVSNSNYSGCKDRTKQHRWEQTQNEKRFDSFSRSNIISNSNSNRNTNEIERSNGEKEKVQREHRQEDSSAWKFIRTNSNDVPNTSSQRSSSQSIGVNRELEKEIKGKKETRNKSTFRTSSSCSDVPNTKSKGSFSSGRSNGQVTMNSKGWTSTRKGTGVRYGANLPDVVNKLYPTPTARDYKDAAYQPNWKESRDKSLPREILKDNKPGGRLNPTFVEMLMAYPMNWTKIDPTE
jgi:DNA (cytosine-5)-methyltransferase 1